MTDEEKKQRHRESYARWKAKNPDYCKQYRERRKKRDPEGYRAKKKEERNKYRSEHREEYNAYQRDYRNRTREKWNKYQRDYARKKRMEKCKEQLAKENIV